MAKRALLIGINKYQIPGADLRGCVNDVKDLSAALIEFYGFKKSDIATLLDGAATQKAMKDGIKKLVRGAKKGDVIVLHYSGHGSNVPDDAKNRDEADGRDEILCPTDLNWDDPLRDDWLRDDVRQAAGRRQLHDHHGLLPFGNEHPRHPASGREGEAALPSESLGAGGGRIGAKPAEESHERAAALRPLVAQEERHRQCGAARSAHHRMPRHADVRGRLHQRQVQRRADVRAGRCDSKKGKGRLTYRQLHDRAAEVLKARKFEQVPQLEGRTSRFDEPLFSA